VAFLAAIVVYSVFEETIGDSVSSAAPVADQKILVFLFSDCAGMIRKGRTLKLFVVVLIGIVSMKFGLADIIDVVI